MRGVPLAMHLFPHICRKRSIGFRPLVSFSRSRCSAGFNGSRKCGINLVSFYFRASTAEGKVVLEALPAPHARILNSSYFCCFGEVRQTFIRMGSPGDDVLRLCHVGCRPVDNQQEPIRLECCLVLHNAVLGNSNAV